MKMFINLNTIVSVISLFTLLGCSIRTDFFIQNLTNVNQIIRIKYLYNISNEIQEDNFEKFSFDYENEIIEPSNFNKSTNLKSLKKIEVKDSVIIIDIPKHSTVRIDKTHNFRWTSLIDFIEIKGKKHNIKDIEIKSIKFKDDYVYKIE
ncbi:hypothetical protein [Riemerella anatipestifer]|uniref:hypothetical protein n=1 Tax=Riemerella anatipestifer TaxID=34085 RepID=UPI00069B16BE|nr:hypothetical protein [Riemerella anatipestifer]